MAANSSSKKPTPVDGNLLQSGYEDAGWRAIGVVGGGSIRPWVVVVLAVAITGSPALAETMNNGSVVALTTAGLGDDVIIAKINASETSFDLATSELMTLKAKGVSDAIIAAMINRTSVKGEAALSPDSPDPMARHPVGLYLLDESAKPARMVKIDASGSSQMKVGNTLGYAFSYGIAPLR